MSLTLCSFGQINGIITGMCSLQNRDQGRNEKEKLQGLLKFYRMVPQNQNNAEKEVLAGWFWCLRSSEEGPYRIGTSANIYEKERLSWQLWRKNLEKNQTATGNSCCCCQSKEALMKWTVTRREANRECTVLFSCLQASIQCFLLGEPQEIGKQASITVYSRGLQHQAIAHQTQKEVSSKASEQSLTHIYKAFLRLPLSHDLHLLSHQWWHQILIEAQSLL